MTLRGGWGWSLLGAAWGLAAFGIAQEFFLGKGARPVSPALLFVLAGSAAHFVAVAAYVA